MRETNEFHIFLNYKEIKDEITYYKIFYNNEWRIVNYSDEGKSYHIQVDDEKINIINKSHLPPGFSNALLIDRIINNIGLWESRFSVMLEGGPGSNDVSYIIYDTEEKRVVRQFSLPGTREYRRFKTTGFIKSIDSKTIII